MIYLRNSNERGHFNHGWLDTYHTFSFGEYHDPKFMGFGSLRVINEDFVSGGKGFPTHGHRDMEIVTYPIAGEIAHKDSTGTSGTIRPYEVQKMTAGRGILHSEFNNHPIETLHLLQIWIVPAKNNLDPSYQQKDFKSSILSGQPTLLASPDGLNGSIQLEQETLIWARKFLEVQTWNIDLQPSHYYWIQVVSGEIQIQPTNIKMHRGDGLAIYQEQQIQIISSANAEILFFDMIASQNH